MSNFYGKRFLSSLLGALSVLSLPVASAVGGKLGEGNLKGEVESSAGRSKNGGKGGKLEVNREVKSVDGLKEVLKETGGKVVRVSPDGKGGFVAFIKTPTGKVVTVAIVGVSLLAIISYLVFFRRKNGESIEKPDIKKSEEIIKLKENKYKQYIGDDLDRPVENVRKGIFIEKEEEISESPIFLGRKVTGLEFGEDNEPTPGNDGGSIVKNKKDIEFSFENSTGGLLSELFSGNQRIYDLFVNRLLGFFFDLDDTGEQFRICKRSLDEFLRLVFEHSIFKVTEWRFGFGGSSSARRIIFLSRSRCQFVPPSGYSFSKVVAHVFEYLISKLFGVFNWTGRDACWEDKISAVLFVFWCSVELGLSSDDTDDEVKNKLNARDTEELKRVFGVIRGYVGSIFGEVVGVRTDTQKK